MSTQTAAGGVEEVEDGMVSLLLRAQRERERDIQPFIVLLILDGILISL